MFVCCSGKSWKVVAPDIPDNHYFPLCIKPLGKIVKILYGTMLFSYLDIFSSHHHYYHCQQTWSHDLGFLEQVTPLVHVQQLKKINTRKLKELCQIVKGSHWHGMHQCTVQRRVVDRKYLNSLCMHLVAYMVTFPMIQVWQSLKYDWNWLKQVRNMLMVSQLIM